MKRNNLSKNIILKKINYNLGIPNSFSKKILNLLLEIIVEGLNRDGKVKLSGFGTFKILNKKMKQQSTTNRMTAGKLKLKLIHYP